MIIHSITLTNIRSYQNHPPINLSTGVTLFAGDIGSGKSTILSAIEFALFGLGDIAGTYLLRHGKKNWISSLRILSKLKKLQNLQIIKTWRKKCNPKRRIHS